MSPDHTRRRYLAGLGAVGSAVLAGCSGARSVLDGGSNALEGEGAGDSGARGDGTEVDGTEAGGTGDGEAPPPTRETPLYQPWDPERVREATVSGGPGKDGIPSVDSPTFAAAAEASMDDDRVVFGYAGESDVRAYPQHVLVWHEITNDVLDGRPVAVTYCPLTGTAMGFERGDTTLGVSGNLVNNNLVMYDRATDSRWPQMLATAVDGPETGAQLREFRLVWTTWGRWREAHPDTEVMTEETGYARRYGSDPYGNYNPTSGYYGGGRPLTDSLDDGWKERRDAAKRVVVGARTGDRAVAFDKPALREAGLLRTDDGAFVAAYAPALDTAWVYRAGDATVEWSGEGGDGDGDGGGDDDVDSGGRVVVDGETHPAADLPLERVYAFDAMWHAWGGFYPETAYVR